MNQIGFAFIMLRHCRERFPIDALFVNAKTAPFVLVLKHLMRQLVDAGRCFAATSVTGDEPAATKLVTFPSQTAKLGDMAFAQQNPDGDDEEQNAIPKAERTQQP